MVGEDVEIMVVDIRGDKVRLGVQARQDVPVHRREVFDAIKRGEKPKHIAPETLNVPSPSVVSRGELLMVLADLKSRRTKLSFTETRDFCDDVIRRLEAMLKQAA
jgi:carbon storage regulator